MPARNASFHSPVPVLKSGSVTVPPASPAKPVGAMPFRSTGSSRSVAALEQENRFGTACWRTRWRRVVSARAIHISGQAAPQRNGFVVEAAA